MKKLLSLIIILCCSLSVSASEVTKFLENICEKDCNKNVTIVSKAEHTDIYNQKIGDIVFPYITYGYGYMKESHCKKKTISYICLSDKNCNPVWGYIIPR